MASLIDESKPIPATPTTQSVRDNFAAAKREIEALQAELASLILQTSNSMGNPERNFLTDYMTARDA